MKPSPLNSSSTSGGIWADGLPGPPFFTISLGTDVTRDALDALFQNVGETSQVIRKTPFLDRPTILNQFRLWLCLLTDLLILLFSPGDLHELKPRRGAHCLQLSSDREFPLSCLKHAERNSWALNPLIPPSLIHLSSQTPRLNKWVRTLNEYARIKLNRYTQIRIESNEYERIELNGYVWIELNEYERIELNEYCTNKLNAYERIELNK